MHGAEGICGAEFCQCSMKQLKKKKNSVLLPRRAPMLSVCLIFAVITAAAVLLLHGLYGMVHDQELAVN